VIEAVRALITPEVTRDVIKELRSALLEHLKQAPDEVVALGEEASKLRKEIGRLTAVLARMEDPVDEIVQAVAQRSKRLRQVEVQLATREAAIGTLDLEARRLEQQAAARLLDLQRAFASDSGEAKDALASLVTEKLKFVAENGGYRVRGLLSLLVPDRVASPAGFEPASPT
jgi:hypothetical protein